MLMHETCNLSSRIPEKTVIIHSGVNGMSTGDGHSMFFCLFVIVLYCFYSTLLTLYSLRVPPNKSHGCLFILMKAQLSLDFCQVSFSQLKLSHLPFATGFYLFFCSIYFLFFLLHCSIAGCVTEWLDLDILSFFCSCSSILCPNF